MLFLFAIVFHVVVLGLAAVLRNAGGHPSALTGSSSCSQIAMARFSVLLYRPFMKGTSMSMFLWSTMVDDVILHDACPTGLRSITKPVSASGLTLHRHPQFIVVAMPIGVGALAEGREVLLRDSNPGWLSLCAALKRSRRVMCTIGIVQGRVDAGGKGRRWLRGRWQGSCKVQPEARVQGPALFTRPTFAA